MQIATAVVRDGFAMTLNGCGVLLLCDLMVQIATAVVRDGLAMTLRRCAHLSRNDAEGVRCVCFVFFILPQLFNLCNPANLSAVVVFSCGMG